MINKLKQVLDRSRRDYSILGFIMPLFRVICEMGDVEEFHVYGTYKTNRSDHELFSVVASVNGIGFPIAYFLLKLDTVNESSNTSSESDTTAAITTPTNHPATIDIHNPTNNLTNNTSLNNLPSSEEIQEARRSQLIARFFGKLREKGLNPRFMFTDKDEGQINAINEVFGGDAVRLCLCHLMRAVKIQLAKPKLANPQYNINEAVNRFSFISRQFQPTGDRTGRRCESVAHRESIVVMMRKHYHMHTNIPIEGGMYRI